MKPRTQIIGRERELAELERAFEGARQGEGGIVLVSGEAGVGITRLAREALERSVFDALAGRAREEAAPPYGPFAGALRDCLRASPDPVSAFGPLAQHLALLLPELGAPPAGASPETLVEAIGGALSQRASQAPTALFLDDLQWADNATFELLPDLVERLAGDPLLILATYRNDEIPRGHPMRRLRNALRRTGRLRELGLAPLGREETRELVTRALGSEPAPALLAWIHEHTQGFPLYIEEFSGALASSGRLRTGEAGVELASGETVPVPESIRDAVLLKLDALGEDARRHVEVAAVAGSEFDLDLVAGLVGREDGMDELFDRALLIETEPGMGSFRHAIIRHVVRDQIPWTRRRSLHRDVAAALQGSGAAPELVAEHWLEAKENERARRALLASADRSCRLSAYRDAVGAAQRALALWPLGEDEAGRLDALEKLAHCAQVSGQQNDAARALREVVSSPLLDEDPIRRAEALRALATVHQLQGAWEQSVEARRASAATFEEAGLVAEAAVEYLALSGRYTAALHLNLALEAVRTAVRLAESAGRWETQARALGLEGNLLAMQGDVEDGSKTLHRGLSLALEHGLTESAAEVYRRLGSVHEYGSDYSGARDAYDTAIDYCQTQGADAAAHTCLGCLSYIVYRTGEWKRTLEVCRDILENEDVLPSSRAVADSVAGLVRAQRGEIRQGRRLLQSSLDISRRHEVTAMEIISLWGLAILEDLDENADAARGHYLALLDRWPQTQDRHDVIPGLCWAATFFASHGQEQETTRCAEALSLICSQTGNTEALAALAHALGESSLLRDKLDDAVGHLARAQEQLEKFDVPLEQALTGFRLGVALARSGAREQAVDRMTSAYRLARRLGARPMAARIARELEALGQRVEEGRHPEATAREKRGGLTPRQLEIARLVATGLTNKEIAHRLYLSPRTVDMHVSNLLERLDCRSRAEAVRKAGDLGLLD